MKSWKYTVQLRFNRLHIGIIVILGLMACNEKDTELPKVYKGPLMVSEDINTLYTDSAKTKMRVKAGKQVVLQKTKTRGQDEYFPEGINVEFYDGKEQIQSTLVADSGYLNKKENIFYAVGNVVLRNLQDEKKLETEALEWIRNEKRIHSNKFVKITTDNQLLTGTGLDAPEDFSDYEILNPAGVFELEE